MGPINLKPGLHPPRVWSVNPAWNTRLIPQSSRGSVTVSLLLAICKRRRVRPPNTRTCVANCVEAKADGYQ